MREPRQHQATDPGVSGLVLVDRWDRDLDGDAPTLQPLLRFAGHEVIDTPNGAEAFAKAKEMAETPGAKVLEAVGKEAANDAKEKLEAAGAVVELA